MKRIFTGIISACLLLIACAVGCGSDTETVDQEKTEYGEKTIKSELPMKLKVECVSSDIEVYRWNKQEVKFEYTKSISGNIEQKKLQKFIKAVEIAAESTENIVSFKCSCKKNYDIEFMLKLRIYVPQRTEEVSISCREGRVKILDHLKGSLFIDGDSLDTVINKFSGKLNVNIGKGGVKLAGGNLLDGTIISTGEGNVYVKAQFEESGEYSFYTEKGILSINIPKELNASIIDYLPKDYSGSNMQEDYFDGEAGEDTAVFRLISGLESINVTRF